MKTVVVINGSGGSGKDTFVGFVSKIVPTVNVSSVDKVKEAASVLGYEGGKSEKDRQFLNTIKNASVQYNDFPFKDIVSAIGKFLTSNNEVLFIHIREPKEINKVKSLLNSYLSVVVHFMTVLVQNSNVPMVVSNEADANVNEYKYDYVVDNSGTIADLKEEAESFVDYIKNL